MRKLTKRKTREDKKDWIKSFGQRTLLDTINACARENVINLLDRKTEMCDFELVFVTKFSGY